MVRASASGSAAAAYSPRLKRSRSKMRVGRALHRRSVFAQRPRQHFVHLVDRERVVAFGQLFEFLERTDRARHRRLVARDVQCLAAMRQGHAQTLAKRA